MDRNLLFGESSGAHHFHDSNESKQVLQPDLGKVGEIESVKKWLSLPARDRVTQESVEREISETIDSLEYRINKDDRNQLKPKLSADDRLETENMIMACDVLLGKVREDKSSAFIKLVGNLSGLALKEAVEDPQSRWFLEEEEFNSNALGVCATGIVLKHVLKSLFSTTNTSKTKGFSNLDDFNPKKDNEANRWLDLRSDNINGKFSKN